MIANAIGPQKTVGAIGIIPRVAADAVSRIGRVRWIAAVITASHGARRSFVLDLIDQEMKSQFNVVLNTVEITGGFRVKALSTQAGDLPLIPDWALGFTGTIGSGATLPAYIVTEDLIEYHWLTDPNPRVFKLGLPSALTQQMVVVKFGAPVVKGANFAHYEVKVQR